MSLCMYPFLPRSLRVRATQAVRETEDELAPFPCNFTVLATLTFVLFTASRVSCPGESVADEGA